MSVTTYRSLGNTFLITMGPLNGGCSFRLVPVAVEFFSIATRITFLVLSWSLPFPVKRLLLLSLCRLYLFSSVLSCG